MDGSHLTLAEFSRRFDAKVKEHEVDWEVVGFLGANNKNVYPFGTDTKVLSTVFEGLASPLIHEVAEDCGYEVEGAPQTIYPDFTLIPCKRGPKIAVDIKTTYRVFNANGKVRKFRYTLGSFTSFLRNPTKNILYPYGEYSQHWVLGFLYTRAEGVESKVYDRKEADKLKAPYQDVEYFIQDKFKIVGESPGSGNTANIGSFTTSDIEELRKGTGPFAKLGKDQCDEYWRHFIKDRKIRPYHSVDAFLEWQKKQGN